MNQLSVILFFSVTMLCSASTLRVKRDATTTTTPKTATAKDCFLHFECGTTQACSQFQCTDLCFSEDCNQQVNNARDSWGWTPLHEAAFENRIDVAKQLLENSANLDSTDNEGETALHWAARENSVGVAKLLLENSANVDSTGDDGQTALHWAAWKNSVDVAKLLLGKSANVDSANNWGATALHYAASYNSVDVAKLLLENSANVDSVDNDGETPLHDAARENSVGVAKLLLANSANLNATVFSGSWKGLTPLQVAEEAGRQEMVELLKNA